MLTIAGFDPSSGAGVTADLAVFSAFGCLGTACITALTVQTTVGVGSIQPVQARIVTETLDWLWNDLPPAGVKIGMLATQENVLAAAAFVKSLRAQGARVPVVLDPVMRSSSGTELLEQAGVRAMREVLLPEIDWVTPNLDELGLLSGAVVRTAGEMERGTAALRVLYPGVGIVATGGHLESPEDLVLHPDGRSEWLRGERIPGRATHGTGCAFSSAMACGLARGVDGFEAARDAKRFVAEAIRRAEPHGRGKGPMNLLWPLGPRGWG